METTLLGKQQKLAERPFVITLDFSKIQIRPRDRVLDIGCGTGRHACVAFTKGAAVVGVDRCIRDLEKARDNLMFWDVGTKENGRWELLAGDIRDLPFPDDFFDLVICSEVLEHIPEDRQAADEIIRVLKNGKNLVVSVPRFFPEKICWLLSKSYHQVEGGHVRIYKKTDLLRMLESGGVRKWASHFAHSLHTPYWWLKCLIGQYREDSPAVNLYHRFLVWDIMQQPWLTKFLDRILNPVLGKSLVLYLRKENNV